MTDIDELAQSIADAARTEARNRAVEAGKIVDEFMPTAEEQLYWGRWTSVWLPGCIASVDSRRDLEEAVRDAFTHGVYAAMHDLDWTRNLINALTRTDPEEAERLRLDVEMATLTPTEYERRVDEITNAKREEYMTQLLETFTQLPVEDQVAFRNRIHNVVSDMDQHLDTAEGFPFEGDDTDGNDTEPNDVEFRGMSMPADAEDLDSESLEFEKLHGHSN